MCCGCAEVGVEGQTRSNSQRTAPACRCSRGCGPGGSAVCNCGRLRFARVTSSATGESQEGYSASDRKGSIALLCVVCLVRACAPPTLASVVCLPFAATAARETRRGVEAEAGAFRLRLRSSNERAPKGKPGRSTADGQPLAVAKTRKVDTFTSTAGEKVARHHS